MYHFSGSGIAPSPTTGYPNYQINGQVYGQPFPNQAQYSSNSQQYSTSPHGQTQTSHYAQYAQYSQPVSGTYQTLQPYYQHPQQQQYSQIQGQVQSPTPQVGTAYSNPQPVYGTQFQVSPSQTQYPTSFQQPQYSVSGVQHFRPPVRHGQHFGVSRAPSAPVTASQPSDTCYNCGLTGHWAQSCPEERRAVPAGDLQRAKKRQKSSGAQLTQRPINQPSGQPSLQRGWTHPLPNQQVQPFNSPITPLSAYPIATTPWPPQPNTGSQGHQPEHHNTIGFPTPSSSHPSHYSSPALAPSNLLVSHQSPQPTGQVSLAYALPRARTSPVIAQTEEPWAQQSTTALIPVVAEVTVDATVEDDALKDALKDLEELDRTVAEYSQGENTLQLSRPIASSLLSSRSASPDMLPYDKTSPSTTSKYFKHDGDKSYKLPAAEQKDWPELRKDPVFASIPAKCESISFQTLITQRQAIVAEIRAPLNISDESDVDAHHSDSHTASSSPVIVDSANGPLTSEQEERLAALGVTGTAKPRLKKRRFDDTSMALQSNGTEIDADQSQDYPIEKKQEWSFQKPQTDKWGKSKHSRPHSGSSNSASNPFASKF